MKTSKIQNNNTREKSNIKMIASYSRTSRKENILVSMNQWILFMTNNYRKKKKKILKPNRKTISEGKKR